MARLDDIAEPLRSHLVNLPCHDLGPTALIGGPALDQRRVALISTAGLQRRGDRPFGVGAADYRVIPGDIAAADLIMSHISTNFDRTGFHLDHNVMLPLDRLHELAQASEIGSVADYHYSFMGATGPEAMAPTARHLAGLLAQDQVNAAVLIPV